MENKFINKCRIDNSILEIIAKAERCQKKEVGYQYIISFNNSYEKSKAKKLAKFIWLDNRTVDCINKETCVEALSFLLENNIKNIDIGPFQLNYIYQKLPLQDYFNYSKSYLYACGLIYRNIQKHGYSWDTIAMYHSYTKEHKRKYLKHISEILKKENTQ